jgi:hypothetical protein
MGMRVSIVVCNRDCASFVDGAIRSASSRIIFIARFDWSTGDGAAPGPIIHRLVDEADSDPGCRDMPAC